MNVIDAFSTFISYIENNSLISLNSKKETGNTNRINAVGIPLEELVKRLFCGFIEEVNPEEKNERIGQVFSYIGNMSNPPDMILRGGDAIEVKQIGGLNTSIPLNSSYPKKTLIASNPLITKACKSCETWKEKDIFYIIGFVKKNQIKGLWFIQGECYAASHEIYENIYNRLRNGISEIGCVEFSKTREFGRLNKVDPLGITYLRLRGMWGIDNPNIVFRDVLPDFSKDNLFSCAIMTVDKYDSFSDESKINLESRKNSALSIEECIIPNTDNPARTIKAKVIYYRKTQ